MSVADVLTCILVMLLWGGQVVAVKIATHDIPPFTLLTIRFAIIAMCLLPIAGFKLKKGTYKGVLLVGMLSSVLHFGFLYVGISQVQAQTSAVIYQIGPLATIVFAAAILGEAVTPSAVVGTLLSFCGVVGLMGGLSGGSLFGASAVAIAACLFALGNVYARKYGPFDALQFNALTALFALPFAAIWAFAFEPWSSIHVAALSGRTWLSILFASFVGGVVGFYLWYRLLNRCQVSKLAPYTLLVPLFAVLISHVLISEQLSMRLALSGAAILAGVALAQFKPLDRLWAERVAQAAQAGGGQ